jgi:hypothetical protein
VIGLLGFLTPPLLGLAGAYLVLAGQAWPVRWVVLVLLFVAYLKTRDMFTTVIVLLLGAGIWMGCRPGRSRAAGRCCRGTGMAPTARSHQRSRQDAPQRFGENQLHVRFRASRRRHRTSPPGYWDSLSCGSWPFSRCGSEAAGCSGSECRSNPITERHSVHIATAAAAPARPPTPPGGSNGIPCARFVRMGMPRRVNRAEETS